MTLAAPLVPVSWGELLDKITILELKAERIADPARRANIRNELQALVQIRALALAPDPELDRLVRELRQVNETLWVVEDEIRLAESQQDFGARFVALARAVYRTNDRRAALKRRINERLASELVEEKSYPELVA